MRPLSPSRPLTGPRGTRHLVTRLFRYRYTEARSLKTRKAFDLQKLNDAPLSV